MNIHSSILSWILASVVWLGCNQRPGELPEKRAEIGPIHVDSVVVIPATAQDIIDAIQETRAPVTLVNIWATYCPPCRAEFPDLVRLHESYKAKGLRLVLVSADFDDQLPMARAFLAQNGVDFPSYVKRERDSEFIDTMDERWSGALPATWIFDAKGVRRHFWEGMATYEVFERKILDVLNKTANHSGVPSRRGT